MNDKEIVELAHKRAKLGLEAESEEREKRKDDIKFVRLGEQWDEQVKRYRTTPGRERPMITVNRLFQFRNQVVNEIRANKPSIKFKPTDNKAHEKTAKIREGLVRNIQYQSKADIAFDIAAEWQVDAGLGYFGIRTDYCDPESFDQDVVIYPIVDPNSIIFDPSSVEPDGSDAKWCFRICDYTKDEAKAEFGSEELESWASDGGNYTDWYGENVIKIAEYYVIEEEKKKLALMQDGTVLEKDEVPEEFKPLIKQERETTNKKCLWYKIAGHKIIDKGELPTCYIPIVPVYGPTVWIDGKKHSHGLIRFAKDPARMYNYFQSANAENLALAPLSPYIVANGQLEGFEQEWANANTVSYPYLVYNPVSDGGNQLPRPQREPGPQANQGFESAMNRAIDDEKACMGIFDASLGNRESNQSGKAILSQQNQASVGNSHYNDSLNRSIAQGGRIINEMLVIYDTKRIVQILGEDGSTQEATLNPDQDAAFDEQNGEYNIHSGKYSVIVDVGPSYATKRQEAAAAMVDMARADPQLMQIAGDIVYSNMDWAGAQDLAERKKLALPPEIAKSLEKDDGTGNPKVDPQVEAQMNQMADQMQHMSQALQEAQAKLQADDDKMDIERFKAETARLEVEHKIALESTGLFHKMAIESMANTLAQGNTGEAKDPDEASEETKQPEQQAPVEMTPAPMTQPEPPQ